MSDRGPSQWPARLMALLTLVIVAGVAGVGWWLMHSQRPRPASSAGEASEESATVAPRPATLRPDEHYYAHVKLIELRPTPPDDDSWEMRSNSPPDIAFRLLWNGMPIFEGAEREDRLIGEWDLLRLDLKDAVMSGQVEVAAAINAPLVRAEPGGILTVEIWDEDATFDDEAGRFDFPADTLREGINTFKPAETGVERVVLDMVPRDTPLPELLERASER